MAVDFHWDWDPLPDDALVVRGGPRDGRHLWLHTVANNLLFAEETGRTEIWGICVGAAVDSSVERISRGMQYLGDWVQAAPLGGVRGEGFDVVMAGRRPHAILLLNEDPKDAEWPGWQRLWLPFTDRQPNPAKGGVP